MYCGYDDAQQEAEGLPPAAATEETAPHSPSGPAPVMFPPVGAAPIESVAPPRAAAPKPYSAPYPPPSHHRAGMPTWLMSILFAVGFLIVGFAVYYTIQYLSSRPTATAKTVVNNGVAARNKVSNPLQKYIEVIGIRLVQDSSHKLQARFVVVNHANTELSDIQANVTLWASTAKSEEDPAGTFTFKIKNLGPNDSKDLSAPFSTKLKIYELPDWQNLTADLQINAQ